MRNRVLHLLKLGTFSPIFAWKNLSYDRLKRLMISVWHGEGRIFIKDILKNYPQLFNEHNESQRSKYLENAKSETIGPIKMNQPDHVEVSIVIYAYNNWHLTQKCIWSIVNITQSIDYEIILADDNSKDETKSAKEYIKGIIS